MITMTRDEARPHTRVLDFVEPLPGFDGETTFTLSGIDDQGLLHSLRSTRDPQLRFVLAPPEAFFPDYRPELSPVVAAALGAPDEDAVRLLLVLTISTGLAAATANLRAPIALCAATGRALQVVLDDEALPMHRRLIGG